MNRYVTMGLTALAGAALFEAALIPGLVIGGAAVLAPKYLPRLRRGLQPLFDTATGQDRDAAPARGAKDRMAANPVHKLAIKQAIAKTITFRIIVTALDFTSNYVVIGQANTAAGLSAFNLVVGPLFYLVHEGAWNYFGPSGNAVDVSFFVPLRPDAKTSDAGQGRFTISRALAKTVTFRVIATAVDFTTLYVVVGDLATAAGLSAFGFVVGPFVYIAHEWVWDYYTLPRKDAAVAVPEKFLPAPA